MLHPPQLSWKKRLLFRAIPVIAILFVFAVLGEIGVRLIVPTATATPSIDSDPRFYFWNKAGLNGRHFFPEEYDYVVRTNSLRLRGSETSISKRKGVQRVLCVGDSFTFGLGAGENATYPKQLETSLNEGSGTQQVEVLNAGVPAWGVSHYYRWLLAEGFAYQPDVVVVGFFDNDWDEADNGLVQENSQGGIEPCADVADAQSRVRNLTEWIPLYNILMSRSQLANQVKQVVRNTLQRADSKTEQSLDQNSPERLALQERRVLQGEKILLAIREMAQKNGARLVILSIGRRETVQSHLAGIEPAPDDPLILGEHTEQRLVRFCLQHQIPLAGSVACFARHCRDQDLKPEDLYHVREGHCNPQGYRLMARCLAPLVRQALDSKIQPE